MVWKAHGLAKCVKVLEECPSLTKCLVLFGHQNRGMPRLRLVSRGTVVAEGEVEVDLRAEHELRQNSVKRTPQQRNFFDVDIPGETEQEFHELSARDERAKRRRELRDE